MQDSPGKGRNPGTTSPDDDEALEEDVTRAGEQGQQQDGRRRKAESNIEQVEDEEAEDDEDDEDEDEADGIGPRS
jgi:hypothetical protein